MVTSESPLDKPSTVGAIIDKLMIDHGPGANREWKQYSGPSGVAKDDGPGMVVPETVGPSGGLMANAAEQSVINVGANQNGNGLVANSAVGDAGSSNGTPPLVADSSDDGNNAVDHTTSSESSGPPDIENLVLVAEHGGDSMMVQQSDNVTNDVPSLPGLVNLVLGETETNDSPTTQPVPDADPDPEEQVDDGDDSRAAFEGLPDETARAVIRAGGHKATIQKWRYYWLTNIQICF